MRLVTVSGIVCCLLLCGYLQVEAKYNVPAEWRVDQDATWLAWPLYEFVSGYSAEPIVLDMMSYITETETVYLLVTDDEQEAYVRDAIESYNNDLSNAKKIDTDKVEYKQIDHTDFWMRDYLLFAQDSEGELVVIDFDFKEWGYANVSEYFQTARITDTNIPAGIANSLGVPLVKTFLSLEAGGLEFNDAYLANGKVGNRKLIISEGILLQPERNPGVTKQQAHNELLRIFDVDEIIWLPKFRFDRENNVEVMLPQCPVSDDGDLLGDAHCHDAESDYYTTATGGGLVEDESTFSGPHLNPETASQRAANGHSDAKYDYALNSITTNGHTDEVVRWIGNDKVLLMEISGSFPSDSIEGRSQFRLETIKEILEDHDIDTVRITAPEVLVNYLNSGTTWESILDMQFTSGEVVIDGVLTDLSGSQILDFYGETEEIPFIAARSYLNFVITDKYVLVPAYDNERDQDALNVLKRVFESSSDNHTGRVRKVVQIRNLDAVNSGGGGMHCISQNQPANEEIHQSNSHDSDSNTSAVGSMVINLMLLLLLCFV